MGDTSGRLNASKKKYHVQDLSQDLVASHCKGQMAAENLEGQVVLESCGEMLLGNSKGANGSFDIFSY